VQIEGQTFKSRSPLGVLGLTVITLGVYYLVWYYKVNDELRRYTRDESISPVRSLMAILFGWMIIVPPFIALYNTGKHIQSIEQRRGLQPVVEPVLTIVFLVLLSVVIGPYLQAHLNPIWRRGESLQPGATGRALPPPPPMPPQ
jgi:hypothetical protein